MNTGGARLKVKTAAGESSQHKPNSVRRSRAQSEWLGIVSVARRLWRILRKSMREKAMQRTILVFAESATSFTRWTLLLTRSHTQMLWEKNQSGVFSGRFLCVTSNLLVRMRNGMRFRSAWNSWEMWIVCLLFDYGRRAAWSNRLYHIECKQHALTQTAELVPCSCHVQRNPIRDYMHHCILWTLMR